MAVNSGKTTGATIAVGANVVTMIVLAVALVVGIQWIGYHYSTRADLTSSGVNSLSPATLSVVKGLDGEVRLTSLYFKTDIEDKDQQRYRDRIADLLDLYRATNRSKVTVETINPLRDLEKRKALLLRVAKLPKFEEEAAGHKKAIEKFQSDLASRLGELLKGELEQIKGFGTLAGEDAQLIGQVEQLYNQVQGDLQQATQELKDALATEAPAYGSATTAIQQMYGNVTRLLKSVTSAADQLKAASAKYSPAVVAFFGGAAERYSKLLEDLEAEQTAMGALPQLDLENLIRDIRSDTSNALIVEAGGGAKAVPFGDIWPPADPNSQPKGFSDRRFLGEQKLTSAVLHLTHKEKPAVVFIRHGGPPLFAGGFMPGMPQAAFGEMKEVLEDANFSVNEWDLATQEEMPKIDPPATRTLFVVLRPTPSQRNPFGQQPNEPQFTPDKLEKVKKALGDKPRVLFLAGWLPMMGSMPAPYEFADYLKSDWGIEAPGDRLVLSAEQVEPGKFRFERDPLLVDDAVFGDAAIVKSLHSAKVAFPVVSPIQIADPLPEGVKVDRLAWTDTNEGTWSVSDLSYYVQQARRDFVIRSPSDYTGQFTIALAATKGDAKAVVISSSDFASDRVAFQMELAMTANGLSMRARNPGNPALFVNSLHWLNDNVEWMNLGSPVDQSTITIDPKSGAMRGVQAAVALVPIAVMLCGVAVWMVRRR
jgi:hypothetical protein